MGFFHVVVWYRPPSPVETYNDARIGLTVIFPFRNKRFPSEFLAAFGRPHGRRGPSMLLYG